MSFGPYVVPGYPAWAGDIGSWIGLEILRYGWIFFVFDVLGWVLEVFFRRFVSAHKWVNPGFLSGPWLPIYGFGCCLLYLVDSFHLPWWANLLIYFIGLNGMEYLGGIFLLKAFHLRLWDYSNQPGNIQGLVCPQFALIWVLGGSLFHAFLFVPIQRMLIGIEAGYPWAMIGLGLVYGVFLVDLASSLNVASKLSGVAKKANAMLDLEKAKFYASGFGRRVARHRRFFFPLSPSKATDQARAYLARFPVKPAFYDYERLAAKTKLGRRSLKGVARAEKQRSRQPK